MTYEQIYDRLQDLRPVFLKRVTKTEEKYFGVQFYAPSSLRDAYVELAKSICGRDLDLDIAYDNHQEAVVIKIAKEPSKPLNQKAFPEIVKYLEYLAIVDEKLENNTLEMLQGEMKWIATESKELLKKATTQ